MAAYDSRTFRRPARTDRCATCRRSGNCLGKNPARERVVRRHLPYHIPDERRGVAARENAARDRAAWDASCSPRASRARVWECGTFASELTSRCLKLARSELSCSPQLARLLFDSAESRWAKFPAPIQNPSSPQNATSNDEGLFLGDFPPKGDSRAILL